jgi:hypothetical protein
VKDEQELSALIMGEASIADLTRFSTDPAGKATASKGGCAFVISRGASDHGNFMAKNQAK